MTLKRLKRFEKTNLIYYQSDKELIDKSYALQYIKHEVWIENSLTESKLNRKNDEDSTGSVRPGGAVRVCQVRLYKTPVNV